MNKLPDDVFYSMLETEIKEELKNISSMKDECIKMRDYPLAAELRDAKHSLQKALDILDKEGNLDNIFEDNRTERNMP